MGIVIEFPTKDQGEDKALRDLFSQMTFSSEELKVCVIDKMAVLKKLNTLPPFSFSLEVPIGVSEEHAKQIAEQVSEELKRYFLNIQGNLISEICRLYIEHCKRAFLKDK